VKDSLFSTSSRPALGPTQPPIQWVLGAFSPGLKQHGREADHSPPADAEVKKMWIYTSTPPHPPSICLHGVVLKWLSTWAPLPYLTFTSYYIKMVACTLTQSISVCCAFGHKFVWLYRDRGCQSNHTWHIITVVSTLC
jgi:hypothetical protein